MSPLVAPTVTRHLLPLANGLDPHFAPEDSLAAVVVYVITAVLAGAWAVVPPLQLAEMVRSVLVVVGIVVAYLSG